MARILGAGHYVPDEVITNRELAAEFGVEEAWIENVCGIRERRRCAEGQRVGDLAEAAARRCLDACGLTPGDIGGLIVGTGTPPRQFPGVSADLSRRLGITGKVAFDVHLASSGGLYALGIATDLCQRHGPILVAAAEHMTEVMRRAPRVKETAILFGDGAGACVVGPGDGGIQIRDVSLACDGTHSDVLSLEWNGPLRMDGRTVILQAVRKLEGCIRDLLAAHRLGVDDIEVFIFHQANRNLLKQVATLLKIPESRVLLNLDRYGNTSAASILIALSEALQQGRIRPGSRALLAAFGAGLSWGAALLEHTA